MNTTLTTGFVALTDALTLIAIKRLELDRMAGARLKLKRMGSWAQLRDALLTGEIDAAHCLPGIPLLSQADAYPHHVRLATAFTLNHYGNAITLGNSVFDQIPRNLPLDEGLQQLAQERRESGHLLTFGSVFPVSKHEFELRHWLGQQGLQAGRDYRLVVIPPPLAVDALHDGRVDGFCVGEPWNSVAVEACLGKIVANSRSLGLPSTEKVLAVNQQWLDSDEHHQLILWLHEASRWLAERSNHGRALKWLSEEVKRDVRVLEPGVTGPHAVDFRASHCPEPKHALWQLEQMQAAGNLPEAAVSSEIAARTFRNDVYQRMTRQYVVAEPS